MSDFGDSELGKENTVEDNIQASVDVKPVETHTAPAAAAPSPNALRKRRREEIAKKVELRKGLITTASSSRLDMSKVHSILSGPRLSWDWQGGQSGNGKPGEDETDDSCGLIVDFHQDSRSALKTHISKAMSQMASREISSQSLTQNSVTITKGNSDEVKQIIQMKRRMIAASQSSLAASLTQTQQVISELDPPPLEPIDTFSMWQETQAIPSSAPSVSSQSAPTESWDATQVFVRLDTPADKPSSLSRTGAEEVDEEEIVMDPISGEFDDVATQVYIPDAEGSTPSANLSNLVECFRNAEKNSARILQEQISKASSVSIPPNTICEDRHVHVPSPSEDVASDDQQEESDGESESESSEDSSEEVVEVKVKKSKTQLSFEEWLAEKKLKKKRRRNQSNEAKSFFEAEAEESEDEELGGIMRKRKDEDGSEGDSEAGSDEDSDLEDLVANAQDEYDLLKKSGKDSKRLAKLHAIWAEERDNELQKAIEEKDFWRKKGLRGLRGELMDQEGGSGGGMNRLQRKIKARRDAVGEEFDAEGNPLAPEYLSGESDYDSMEIDSDDFFNENSDEERENLNQEEIAIRKERRQRELERRKRDKEFKLEMNKRRQILKQKLREERMLKQKDQREIQAGLGIMTEEDRETFKLINRTQGVFGYTQASSAGNAGGITTQSTSASVSSQPSPIFSFLGSGPAGGSMFTSKLSKSRRSSVSALELD